MRPYSKLTVSPDGEALALDPWEFCRTCGLPILFASVGGNRVAITPTGFEGDFEVFYGETGQPHTRRLLEPEHRDVEGAPYYSIHTHRHPARAGVRPA